jgi:hypothetical protein
MLSKTPEATMNKTIGSLLLSMFLLSACGGFKLVSDYDPVIDQGVTEFSEQFNTHMKNMGDLGGTLEGTYQENLRTYNALDAKLEVLTARASARSEGQGCKLQKKIVNRIKQVMNDHIPPALQTSDSASEGTADGCNVILLEQVKIQLDSIKNIHKNTDTCGPQKLSCLRPATVKSASSIANQTINAVSVVEVAKKQ